jgi:hypothetical protein
VSSSAPSRPRDLIDDLLASLPPSSDRESGIPPARVKGGERAKPPSLEELASGLERIRPLAKTTPTASKRDQQNADALERYRRACDVVIARGWSWRQIARVAECTLTMVQACYAGHRYVPCWLLDSFPEDIQREIAHVRLQQLARKAR